MAICLGEGSVQSHPWTYVTLVSGETAWLDSFQHGDDVLGDHQRGVVAQLVPRRVGVGADHGDRPQRFLQGEQAFSFFKSTIASRAACRAIS